VEQLKRNGQEAQQRYGQEAMQREHEAVRNLADQDDIQQRNVLPEIGNDYDNSTERAEPK
jgi:hypothetical protein